MTDDGKLILEELGFCNCTHPAAVLEYLRHNLLRSHGVKDDPELSMPTIFRLANAARRHQVARQTLVAAATEGRLESWVTGCGCRLTTDAAVQAWLDDDSEKRGRPRKPIRPAGH
jgi:hypothetical protein